MRPMSPTPPESPPRPSVTQSFLSKILARFRYSQVSQKSTDIESGGDEEAKDIDHSDTASDTQEQVSRRRRKKVHWSEYEETPADKWGAVIFLLLLLSALFNLFLLFNGPPNGIPRHPKPKDSPLPHKGFQFKEHDKNYTCYETTTTAFEANYEYSNTFSAYDHLWREMQGKTNGIVYTRINRPDGEVRRAGLAMFHQLDCLMKIRSVVQSLQNGEKDKEDVGEHHGYWPHCFDYLRQVILCNADDSIEVSKIEQGRWVVEGFGSAKECRDKKWLYDVTDCGEQGCEGRAFFRSAKDMKNIHKEEEEEVEKFNKDQDGSK